MRSTFVFAVPSDSQPELGRIDELIAGDVDENSIVVVSVGRRGVHFVDGETVFAFFLAQQLVLFAERVYLHVADDGHCWLARQRLMFLFDAEWSQAIGLFFIKKLEFIFREH